MTAVLSAPAGRLSPAVDVRFDAARESVRQFVRARVDDTVVFTRDAAVALDLAARITPGDVVVLDIGQGADLLRWCAPRQGRDRARFVPACETIEDTLVALETELASAPASLLVVTAVSDITGEVLPMGRLASLAHRSGARILVDAAQLVGHRPVSVVSHGIDYVAFGEPGRRTDGPGVLIGRRDWFDAADVDASPDSDGVPGAIAVAEACRVLADLGPETIGLHERRLAERLDAGLAAIGGFTPLRIFTDSTDRAGVAGYTVDGLAPPADTVRASFGAGTTVDDIDRILDAFRARTDQTDRTRPGVNR
ncbi:aminotransferase class V-fold PLP-dependent enzyme [Gordonia sp. p3-SID1431]|uniref:aminotransferase class V-fold PLP-dependent enzyme n=1 Tax=Gordonia sp. p3-SID1431 TaxID=2916159 RepID=UPI0021A87F0E|nr:aminotransferase class V-fold PLP-dependent enzyme [Gordonia sp. p3-SID1431]MCT1353263.1 aminotransferase class V-fold PLP-dependent enzyme [Gordonia sp. p3-SID1431]